MAKFETGDRGQRYEVWCKDGQDRRMQIGWSDSPDSFRKMVEEHPEWHSREVVDRQGRVPPMIDLERVSPSRFQYLSNAELIRGNEPLPPATFLRASIGRHTLATPSRGRNHDQQWHEDVERVRSIHDHVDRVVFAGQYASRTRVSFDMSVRADDRRVEVVSSDRDCYRLHGMTRFAWVDLHATPVMMDYLSSMSNIGRAYRVTEGVARILLQIIPQRNRPRQPT